MRQWQCVWVAASGQIKNKQDHVQALSDSVSMGGQRASERLDDKVRSYELFLNDVLKEDLKKSKQLKAKLQAELQEFEELEANLRLVQEVGRLAALVRASDASVSSTSRLIRTSCTNHLVACSKG